MPKSCTFLSYIFLSIALSVFAEANDRPNVLFIMVDDLRPSLGCYGDRLAITPNIDRFARSARVFQRVYCHQAVCGPSRASILTGRLFDPNRQTSLLTLDRRFPNMRGYEIRCD
jgi:iduronate 2-sulfatase